MDEKVTVVSENTETAPKLFPIAESARKVGITYQRLKYAIANRWVTLAQENPDLISEEQLKEFAHSRGLEYYD